MTSTAATSVTPSVAVVRSNKSSSMPSPAMNHKNLTTTASPSTVGSGVGSNAVASTTTMATTGGTLSYKPTYLVVKSKKQQAQSQQQHSKNNNNNTNSGTMRFVIMDAPRQSNLHLYIKELSMYHVHHVVRVCEPTYHADAFLNAGITCHDMEYPDGHSPPNDVIDRWLQLVDATFFNKTNGTATNNNSGTTSNTPSGNKGKNNRKSTKEQQATAVGAGDAVVVASGGNQGDAAPVSTLTTTSETGVATTSATDPNAAESSAAAAAGAKKAVDEEVALAVHCVAGLGRAPVLVAIALIEFAHMDAVESVALIRRHRRGSINEKQLLYLEGYKRRYYKRRGGDGSGGGANGACLIM